MAPGDDIRPLVVISNHLPVGGMLVTPLKDGMNLVAKEYVCQGAVGGRALLLSEFTQEIGYL